VELDDESVIDFSLDFLLRDNKPGQSVVSALLHALHREEVVRIYFLNQENLCVGTATETGDALEVLSGNVEVLLSAIFVLFLSLLNIKEHVGCLLNVVNHFDIALLPSIVKGRLFESVNTFLRLIAGVDQFLEKLCVATDASQVDWVLLVCILHTDVDIVLNKQICEPLVVVQYCVVQRAVSGSAFLKIHIYCLVLSVVDVDQLCHFFEVTLFRSRNKLVASLQIRFPPWAPRFLVKVSHLFV
jgi:hypothetical protein